MEYLAPQDPLEGGKNAGFIVHQQQGGHRFGIDGNSQRPERFQECCRFVRRHRSADEVALHHVALQGAQVTCLPRFFHAFGDHFESKTVAERNDGLDDRGITAVGGHIAHEGDVHLELVHFELLQIAQRRIAGAEVVDRQTHAECLDLGQRLEGTIAVEHHEALGDLEFELLRRDAGFLQRILDRFDQAPRFSWTAETLTAVWRGSSPPPAIA